jgi:aryl-alcohol dehydrogenase-like predicted oxidoreductase
MKYGINNTLGQPTLDESFKMLDIAIDNGIKVIDTARAYGEAEEILGKYFLDRKNSDKVKVISKLCPNVVEVGEKDVRGVVRRELEDSLKRLNIERLDGYLLHTPGYIYDKEILKALISLKKEKLVENIGVSIYEIEDGEEAIRTGVVDYIQLPFSILDQRGVKTSFISNAKQSGITIFTRSAFLQGLFTMDKDRIPMHLQEAIPYINIFEKLLDKYQINKISALINFVKQEKGIDYLVFGVDTPNQLIEDIDIYKNEVIPNAFINEVKMQFNEINKSIIFPSLWSNGKKAK